MNATLSAVAMCLLLSNVHAQPFPYQLVHEIDFKHAFGGQYKNVIKLYDVTVDETHGLAYTTGSQTPYASMIDIDRRKEIGSVTLPFPPQVNTLRCNPVNGYLLAAISDGKTLYAVNPWTSENTGTHTFTSHLAGLAVRTVSNTLFACDGNAVETLDGNTLSPLGSFNTGMINGGIALDSASDVLYIVSRNSVGGNVTVKTFRAAAPNSLLRTIPVPSDTPLGEIFIDPAADRMLLVGLSAVKSVKISSGAVESTIDVKTETQSTAYSASMQTLFLDDEDGYSADGEHGSWGKIFSYVFPTGALDSMKRGDRPSNIALDDARHVLVVPSMHSAIVELVDLLTHTVDTVDIGETADEFALSPNHRTLYIAKRLGGSSIVLYDKQTRSLRQMPSGNWPCVAEVDSGLQRLFVLNEFESSISIYDCRTDALLKTLRLSPPEARTDAIPTMILDQPTHKLYVGIPESGTITLVDAQTMTEVKTASLPGFHFDHDIHYSIGVFQLMTAPEYNRLFVLQGVERKFVVLDMATLSFIDSTNVRSQWPTESSFQSNLLAYDNPSKHLFFGNHILDPQTLAPVGLLPASDRLLGYSHDRTILYSISAASGMVTVHEHDPVTYNEGYSQSLFQQEGIASPVFLFDSRSEELYIAEFNFAVLKHYHLDRTTRVPPFLLTDAHIDFGDVRSGQSSSRSLTVYNTGGASLAITATPVTGGDFAIDSGGGAHIVPQGDSTRIILRFQPKGDGVRTGTLAIESNASNGSPAVVSLLGVGIPALPRVSVSASVLDFGPISSPAELPLIIRNIGTADLTVSNQSLAGPDSTAFRIRQYAGTSISPGDSSTAVIECTPSGSGSRIATFRFETNDPGSLTVEVGLVADAIVAGFGRTTLAAGDVILPQSFPNPFNPATTIQYTLFEEATVAVDIVGMDGRLAGTLSPGLQERGTHRVLFDASGLPAGTYYARMIVMTRSGTSVRTVHMMRVR